MIIIGIDPGSQRTGFAVIEARGPQIMLREIGYWDLLALPRAVQGGAVAKVRPSLGLRLEKLARNSRELFKKWNPQFIGLEKVVTFKSAVSSHTLSEARGVVRLAAYELLESADLRLHELSPTSVKKEAAGFGGASKEEVRRGLRLRFRDLDALVQDQKLKLDAFDALAIAWTTWVLKGRQRRMYEQHRI